MRLLFAIASESRLKFKTSGGMERCFWYLLAEMSKHHKIDAVCRSVYDAPSQFSIRALGPVAGTKNADFEVLTAEYCSRISDIGREYDAIVAFNFPQLLRHIQRPVACIFFNDGISDVPSSRAGQVFVFHSQWLRNEFVATRPIEMKRCYVLPMGVDCHRFVPQNRESLSGRPLTLLFSSVWHPGKGIRQFLEMCEALSELKVQFRAVLVGSTLLWDFGDQQNAIHPECDRKEVEQIVNKAFRDVPELTVIGEVEYQHMPGIYANADLLVSPSQWRECFSLAAVESMASGTPVIASSSGGFVELIRDGQTGYLLPVRPSATDLTKAIVEIVDSGGVPGRMRRNACQSVLSLSWREAARRLDSILIDAISQSA